MWNDMSIEVVAKWRKSFAFTILLSVRQWYDGRIETTSIDEYMHTHGLKILSTMQAKCRAVDRWVLTRTILTQFFNKRENHATAIKNRF